MPSLCQLSTGSRFCLNQLGTKSQESSPNCQPLAGALDATSCGSTQDGNGIAKGRGSRSSFLVNLADICNKMLLPMDEFRQDCGVTAALAAANTPPSLKAEPACNCSRRTAATSDIMPSASPDCRTNQNRQMTEREHRSYSVINNANICRMNSTQDEFKLTTTNSLSVPQPEIHHGCYEAKGNLNRQGRTITAATNSSVPQPEIPNGCHEAKGNSYKQRLTTTGTTNSSSMHQPKVSHACHEAKGNLSKQRVTITMNSSSLPQSEMPPGCIEAKDNLNEQMPNTATNSSAQPQPDIPSGCFEAKYQVLETQRPRLPRHGVPFWSLSRYFDYRAAPQGKPTQLYEPVLQPRLHRHMVIEDNYLRIKEVLPRFRAPSVLHRMQ